MLSHTSRKIKPIFPPKPENDRSAPRAHLRSVSFLTVRLQIFEFHMHIFHAVHTVFKLTSDIRIAHDRPCNELWKHCDIGSKHEQIFLCLHTAPVYIHRIADDLKCIKADTKRHCDTKQRNFLPCQHIEILDKKSAYLQ